jgi:hypothetical protein
MQGELDALGTLSAFLFRSANQVLSIHRDLCFGI